MESIMKLAFVAFTLFALANAALAAKARSSCTDNYIWWADGSVDCKFLEKESLWGMHKNPNYWCNHYVLTDCCATCNRLRDLYRGQDRKRSTN